MENFHRKRKGCSFFRLASCTFIVVLLSIIPVRLAIALTRAPIPQAIFTLGAVSDREVFTGRFAQLYPSLQIWVSSGAPPDTAREIFQTLGISNTRVHLDRRAVDTVTNFTSLVADFKKRNFQHIYLITSDFHMLRAKVIATFVLGSQGIAFTPVFVPSEQLPKSEPWLRILRDSGRALLWIVTGHTGASLHSKL